MQCVLSHYSPSAIALCIMMCVCAEACHTDTPPVSPAPHLTSQACSMATVDVKQTYTVQMDGCVWKVADKDVIDVDGAPYVKLCTHNSALIKLITHNQLKQPIKDKPSIASAPGIKLLKAMRKTAIEKQANGGQHTLFGAPPPNMRYKPVARHEMKHMKDKKVVTIQLPSGDISVVVPAHPDEDLKVALTADVIGLTVAFIRQEEIELYKKRSYREEDGQWRMGSGRVAKRTHDADDDGAPKFKYVSLNIKDYTDPDISGGNEGLHNAYVELSELSRGMASEDDLDDACTDNDIMSSLPLAAGGA